ncbi:hypothetical protein [Amycolatopsis sp. NPDC051128]|uniref:hypothetical protein n=1 Tax=Amycolatopsis sp. NPDC051128 TaxID=3155412 RepID=UPI003448D57D
MDAVSVAPDSAAGVRRQFRPRPRDRGGDTGGSGAAAGRSRGRIERDPADAVDGHLGPGRGIPVAHHERPVRVRPLRRRRFPPGTTFLTGGNGETAQPS